MFVGAVRVRLGDNDTNYHMDFIARLANMKARNYSTGEVDKLMAKFIAGRIIPAIAATTAMGTGLVCLELYKVLAGGHKVGGLPTWLSNKSQTNSILCIPVSQLPIHLKSNFISTPRSICSIWQLEYYV
ncbi:hypothetical protein BC332_01770 [Capsicum chinense]|nr:hypothetical protein BC332_01770 [Capsicum chinense]